MISIFQFGGVDYTIFFEIIAVVMIAYYLGNAYYRGDLDKYIHPDKKQDAHLDESYNPNRIELFEGIPDMKFENVDTHEYFDYMGADILYDGPDKLDLKVILSKDGKQQPSIKCTDSQIVPVLNRSLLSRRQVVLKYSSKGANGILNQEINELKKSLSDAMTEAQGYRNKYERKLQDVDQQIANEQESRGRHRRSPTMRAVQTFQRPKHERDDFDDADQDVDVDDAQ